MAESRVLDTPVLSSVERVTSHAPDRTPGLLSAPYRPVTLGIVALTSLVAFEALAVATAMPAAAADLQGHSYYAVAFAGTLAASLVGIVIAGERNDVRGPVGVLGAAVTTLVAGLLIAGFAPSMAWLIVGRIVQGMGIGAIGVTLYVVAAKAYPEHLHTKVFAAMSAAWVIPSLVGPAISALIVDTVGWRWVFLLVPPAAVPAMLMLWPAARRLQGEAQRAGADGGLTGWALVAAVGIAGLNLAGPGDGPSAMVWGVPAGLLVAIGVRRLLPSGTLGFGHGFPSLIAVRGLSAAAFFGAEAFLPLMLIDDRGYSTLAAGATLTAAAVGW